MVSTFYFQGYGPETITVGQPSSRSDFKYLFYIHDYAKMHPFDEVNCVANIYGFYGNEGPIQDPLIGNEKFFIVGCFKTPDEFVFIDENVSEEPALYPRNCP